MPQPDIFDDAVTDESVHEMRVGQIGTVNGRLDAVLYGNDGRLPGGISAPALRIAFSDWSNIHIALRDYATAKGLRIPIRTYVTVKVQCISEDAEVMALAIWEMGNPVPIALGEPMGTTVPKEAA